MFFRRERSCSPDNKILSTEQNAEGSTVVYQLTVKAVSRPASRQGILHINTTTVKSTRCSVKKLSLQGILPTDRRGKLLSPPVVAIIHNPQTTQERGRSAENIDSSRPCKKHKASPDAEASCFIKALGRSYSVLVAAHIAAALAYLYNRAQAPKDSLPQKTAGDAPSTSLDLHILPRDQHLGSGSFGEVHKVEVNGLCYALKTCAPGAHEVESEGAIAQRLAHPNIVTTVAHQTRPVQSGEGDVWQSHILMELCTGSLDEGIEAGRFTRPEDQRLDWELIRTTLLDVAQGLAYMHAQGVIHLDLKVANVFLSPTSRSDREFSAKIGDFGLSRQLQQGQEGCDVERPGTIMIAAPELLDHKQASPKSDVHAFGILAWMLVTGRVPYSRMDIEDVIEFIVEGVRPSIDASWPGWLKTLMKDCWAADPSLRPSASELVPRLERASKEVPAACTPRCPTRGPPPGFQTRRPTPPGFGPRCPEKPQATKNHPSGSIRAVIPNRPPGFD